jgi:hypothetical protein
MKKVTATVILFLVFVIVGCEQRPAFTFEIDETMLQEGDIIFRKGMSIASRVVLAADKEGGYSHIGIVVKDSTGWKVIHAVPGETDKENPEEIMKKESLAQFFAPNRAVAGAIYRLDTTETIGYLAAQKAKMILKRKPLFDHNYDLEDSTEMYCTELLYVAYLYAGIDISEGRRTKYPALRSEFLLPGDILVCSKLKKVWAQ